MVSHYPSWGFETVSHTRVQEGLQELITPHGDLKPAQINDEPFGDPVFSLPLMAI